MPKINSNELQEWWNHPVGKEVKGMLRERMEKIAHTMAEGSMLNDMVEQGKCSGRYLEIQDLLEMTFEELMGGEDVKET